MRALHAVLSSSIWEIHGSVGDSTDYGEVFSSGWYIFGLAFKSTQKFVDYFCPFFEKSALSRFHRRYFCRLRGSDSKRLSKTEGDNFNSRNLSTSRGPM